MFTFVVLKLAWKFFVNSSDTLISLSHTAHNREICSGVARLGHTGARALATRGCAPPVQVCMQILGADSIIVDRESGAKTVLRSKGAV